MPALFKQIFAVCYKCLVASFQNEFIVWTLPPVSQYFMLTECVVANSR